MFKKEVKGLVLLGFLESSNDSEWGAPYFPQPEPKVNRVRFISNFRNLNTKLKRKPLPITKIHYMLLKL